MAKSAKGGRLPRQVFIKAAHLEREEGMDRDQAIAVAANMYREGRLTKEGEYVRSKGKRGPSRGRQGKRPRRSGYKRKKYA